MAAREAFVWNANVYFDGTQITTEGGVEFNYTPLTVETQTDATGGNIYDVFTNGGNLEVIVHVAEWDLDAFATVYGAAATQTGSGSTSKVAINADIGSSYRSSAASLVVKGIVEGVEDTTEEFWVTVPLAYPEGGPFKSDKGAQFTTAIKFTGLPDTTASNLLFFFGDTVGS